jgi:membrane peptidoglycan carboxypeptidase
VPGGGSRRRATTVALVGLLALLTTACSTSVVTLELPSLAGVTARPASLQSRVVAADGSTLAVLRREHREPVRLADVPTHLVEAVLTAEDRRFFDHAGVDARAIVRAALANQAAGTIQQGGSTITQQLVKNVYLPEADRSYDTKLAEALLARELEAERSKASILEEYLNTVYLGEGAYGVQAAAETYFRRDVEDLDVAQAALLAAIIRAPSSLAPTVSPEAAQERRDDVLRRMADAGHLTDEERDAALATAVEVTGRAPLPEVREPHLVDLVTRTLLDDPRFGDTETDRADRLYRGGLTVHVTVDLELQQLARDTLARHLPDAADPEAAVTVLDPATGRVLAVTGNRAYEDLQFDLATQAQRQPGSTFKTFVLAAAINDGWHPDDHLDGRPGDIDTGSGTWRVRNFDRTDPGEVTLAGATRTSSNAAYARLGIDVGIDRVAGLARELGVASPVPGDEPQISLGGGELGVTTWDLAAAYGTLANGGTRVSATVIDRIEGPDGEVVWRPDRTPHRAVTPDVAYVTTQVLQGAVEGGTGLAARVPGWEVAGKTGTTSDHADAWFAGTTPALAAAVWVGHVEGAVPLLGVQGVPELTGGSIPARIFGDLLRDALAGTEPVPFELDDEHWVDVEVDPETGRRAAAWCPGERVRLPRVLAPTETCPGPPPPPAAPEPTPVPARPPEVDPDPSPAPEPPPTPEPVAPVAPPPPDDPRGLDVTPPAPEDDVDVGTAAGPG